MRVGLFFNDLSASSGGAHSFEREVAESVLHSAMDSRHEFILLSPRHWAHTQLPPNVNYEPFPGPTWRRVLNRARNAMLAKPYRQNFLQRRAKDLWIDMLWFLGAEGIQTDVPYIATVWDLQHRLQPWFPEVSGTGAWSHRERFYSEYLRRAAFVITGTEAGAQELSQFYGLPLERILIIPHPTPQFSLIEQSSHLLPPEAVTNGYIFYPAQFWSHKNHVGLLHALRELHDRGETLHLVCVGSDKGNSTFTRDTAVRLGLNHAYHDLGFVSRADLRHLYEHAVCLTYVSFFGPENLPPLEAFALGCPVVAASVPGAAEQLGDAALLVDPTSETQIADAIQRLQNDAVLRQTLVDRGLERTKLRTGRRYVTEVINALDRFDAIRRSWQ